MADKVTSLDALLLQTYGVQSYPVVNRLVDTVGITPIQIASNNPRRIALNIVNLSVNSVYLMIDNRVSSTRGFYLGPGGGTLALIWRDDTHLLLHEWWAIAGAADSEILVLEELLV